MDFVDVLSAATIIGAIIIFVILVYAIRSIKIIRPYEKGVVERLGKFLRTWEPGLHLLIPFLDRVTKVDMRENVVDVPPQEVITKDNVAVTVDAVVYYEATDPFKLIYNVTNFYLAATKLAQTNLRNVVGEMQLDECLTSREKINITLRDILDEATDKWGVRVVRVELQRIEPPGDVTQAMHRQMKAERERRAMILEAEGDRAAAIARAEGTKQSAILEAEGKATAIKEIAAAERAQKILVAEGEAQAIRNVYGAIHDGAPTQDLITIRYLETLKYIANGNATKIFMPLEVQGLANAAGVVGEMLGSTLKQMESASSTSKKDWLPPAPKVK